MSAVIAGKSYPGNESWNELNSGLMVIEPQKGLREALINKMNSMVKRKRILKNSVSHTKGSFFSKVNLLKSLIVSPIPPEVFSAFTTTKSILFLRLKSQSVFERYSAADGLVTSPSARIFTAQYVLSRLCFSIVRS